MSKTSACGAGRRTKGPSESERSMRAIRANDGEKQGMRSVSSEDIVLTVKTTSGRRLALSRASAEGGGRPSASPARTTRSPDGGTGSTTTTTTGTMPALAGPTMSLDGADEPPVILLERSSQVYGSWDRNGVRKTSAGRAVQGKREEMMRERDACAVVQGAEGEESGDGRMSDDRRRPSL